MSQTIEIAGHGGRLTILVLGYENPSAKDPSDANWLTCKVQVTAGPFAGDVDAAFTTDDFARLRRGMRALLDQEVQSVEFEPIEQALSLKMAGARTGAVSISGAVRYSSGPAAAVSFTLESDLSYLSSTMASLEAVIDQYPVQTRGAP
jgi:hypothetical protein